MASGTIFLVGFMGSGKSTIGPILAGLLGYESIDSDTEIERRHGPIPAIFAARGESEFRAIERAVLADLADRGGLVIATGGGIVLDADNRALLHERGRTFTLHAGVDTIIARVLGPGRPDRPLLAVPEPEARVRQLLADRAPLYAEFETIRTDGRTPRAIAAELAERITSVGSNVADDEASGI